MIAYRTFGKEENPAVLFIHGFPMSGSMWQKQTADLSHEYFCVTCDLRGLGHSMGYSPLFTMEHLADDIAELAAHLSLKETAACGLSMGGYVLLRVVEKFPALLKGVIFCDTKADADDNAGKLKRANAIQSIEQNGAEAFVRSFIPTCLAEGSAEKMGTLYTELLEEWTKANAEALIGSQLAMLSRTDTNGMLRELSLPALFICGEQDTITPPAVMNKMAANIEEAKFRIIPGAGHLAPLEQPQAVNIEIRKFLQGIFSR
jgi:pimeloyl-ACP methyl ester carboxylesterase